MDMDDLSVQMTLNCPICGCSEFAYEIPASGQEITDNWMLTCVHCGRSFTRADLIESNSESINATISDMGDDIVDAINEDLKKLLKKQGWGIK